MRRRRFLPLILTLCIICSLFAGCAHEQQSTGLSNGWVPERSMELQFATQFSVDYYQDGYKLISLADGSRYIVIPEGAALPKGIADDIVVLYQPLENIYLAATSAMCLFDALDS